MEDRCGVKGRLLATLSKWLLLCLYIESRPLRGMERENALISNQARDPAPAASIGLRTLKSSFKIIMRSATYGAVLSEIEIENSRLVIQHPVPNKTD